MTKQVKVLSSGSGPTTTYAYDETGQLLSLTDPCGNTTCSDMAGSNHTTSYSYADSYTTLSSGQNVAYTPSANTNAYLTTITDPLGHAEHFTYDFNNGQLTAENDQNSQITRYLHNDPFGRLSETDSPDGGQTINIYTDAGPNPSITTCQRMTGAAGATCSSTSPPSGWKVTVATIDGMGHTVQAQLASDAEGADITDTSYDGMGRVYTRSNPHRSASSMTDGTTTYTYDSLGRVTQVADQDGSTGTTSYSGNQTTVTDEAGNQRKSQTDAFGRLTSVWEAPNQAGFNFETDYQYNVLNNLICTVQKAADTTTFTSCSAAPATWRPRSFVYDSLSRLTSATNVESGTITYGYDANGNLSSKVAPAPNQTSMTTVTTTYGYDALDRLTQKSYSDGKTSTVKYGYDGVAPSGCTPPTVASIPGDGISATPANTVGRRSSMCDASGAAAWVYNPVGSPKIETQLLGGVTKTTGNLYYFDGRRMDIHYHSGDFVYQWTTAAGRSNGVGDSVNNYVFSNVFYTPDGQVTQTWQGSSSGGFSGIATQHLYNNRLQPVLEYSIVGGSGQFLFKRCYDFHLNGGMNVSYGGVTCTFSGTTPGDNGNIYQLVNKLDDNRTQNFAYDSLNRISQAYTNGPNWGEAFTIDAWGNLTNRSGVTGKNTYEPLNAPANAKNQLTGFGYDSAGNMTSNGIATYTYDAENRLISAGGMSYIYDGDGRRVEKCTGGAAPGTCATNASGTLYWADTAGEVVDESDLSGNINEEYFYFNGSIAARVDRPSGTVHYYISDHLGSARIIATPNSSNTVAVAESDYYPYGGEIPISGSDTNHYKFTGKERDSESGLDNFEARYFGSSMGRFMSPDPDQESGIDNMGYPQMWNGYAYVGNNPLNRTDPSGRTVSICDTNGQYCQAVSDEDYAKAQQADQYNHAASLDQLKQNDGSLSNITDSNGNVVGTVMYTRDENAPAEGVNPEGEKFLAGYAAGGIIGRAFGAAWGTVAGWFGRGAEAGGTAAGQTAGQLGVRAGGVIERVFQTSAGPVQVYAKVEAEGTTAVIKELAVYPAESNSAVSAGFTQTRQGLKAVLNELKESGFTDFRMEPQYRVGGANAGGYTGTLKGKL